MCVAYLFYLSYNHLSYLILSDPIYPSIHQTILPPTNDVYQNIGSGCPSDGGESPATDGFASPVHPPEPPDLPMERRPQLAATQSTSCRCPVIPPATFESSIHSGWFTMTNQAESQFI